MLKIPKSLPACADLYQQVREARLAKDKEAKALKDDENALSDYLIENLSKNESMGIAGKLARVTIVPKLIPTVEDWPAFYAYIKKNNAFELLQRRVGQEAVNERWEEGKTVPGVVAFRKLTLSLSIVKGGAA